MKRSAIDYVKINIDTLYKKYYQFDTSDWMYELFDYDPFEVFDVVDDFELASLNLQPGEIDFQNCKILYTHMPRLTESQASDERLWAGLCNKTFYPYIRTRWQYARKHLKRTAEDSAAIKSRFFYRDSGRAGMFRNSLSRSWWTGKLTYSEKSSDHWVLLDALGADDILSKISDILRNNSYASNRDIVEGFCLGLKFFRDRGIHLSTREHIRPTAQYLNAIGGVVLLDMFTADEIRKMVIERIGLLLKGVDIGLSNSNDDDELDSAIESEERDELNDAEEINMDFGEYIDNLEHTNELDLNEVLGELSEVEYGSRIYIHKMPEDTFFISQMPLRGEKMNALQTWFLGKKIGSIWKYAGNTYEITDIRR